MRYQPGGKITVDGVEYEISAVELSASRVNGVYQITYWVRAYSAPDSITVEITTPTTTDVR